MRFRVALLAFAVLALTNTHAAAASPRAFLYLSPMPGSDKVSCWNNIAIRQGGAIDRSSVVASRLSVAGTSSGPHTGRFQLANDGQTLLFTPDQPYALGEIVHVRLATGTRTLAGGTLPELAYEFRVSPADPRQQPRVAPERFPDPPAGGAWWQQTAMTSQTTSSPCDTLLPGFPAAHVSSSSDPDPGVLFTAPFSLGPSTRADYQITDDRGQPIWQRTFSPQFFALDFTQQPNGLLTFWMNGPFKFYALDSSYAFVDSFTTGNGYSPDPHELQILPNGHVLIGSYDPQPVGMDTVVAGGNPNAIVTGYVVQELDENKNVVFQWRSWDHFKITDASISPDINLKAANIDYVHGNSIALMPDGNLLISCRHMNELTKVDRQTGETLWRMGLNSLNNEWSFPNDTRGFSHQHDARILPNGNLTVFDNGNNLSPQYSRALEFSLDEENLVATKVWEYRHNPDIFSSFMGSVQRHPDGSTTIGWGGNFGVPSTTDLHSDGSIGAELVIPSGTVNYRGFRFPWRTNRFLTDKQDLDIAAPAVGTAWSQNVKVWNHWNQPITINCLRTADAQFTAALAGGSLPVTLAPGETTLVRATYHPVSVGDLHSRLYIVQQGATEMVAQPVDLLGHIANTDAVDPGVGSALATTARPNPLHTGTSIEFTLPSTGRVKLDIYDLGGRLVAPLLDETRAAGRHVVQWSAAGRAGGLYFYRLRVAGKTIVRKLVVAS